MREGKDTVLAVVGDLHAGSTLGLCPPEVALPDGGTYRASPAQCWLWECWRDFWAWAREIGQRRRRILVLNGDLVEGVHHRTAEIISPNVEVHLAAAVAAIRHALATFRPETMFIVRGTPSHAGEQGALEERLAREFEERIPHDPPLSRYGLLLSLRGLTVHIAHHVQGWVRPWTSSAAVGREAVQLRDHLLMAYLLDGAPEGLQVPALSIRGHRHRFADSGMHHVPRVVVGPAWQLATHYSHKIAPSRGPDIGGLVVLFDRHGYRLMPRLYVTRDHSHRGLLHVRLDEGDAGRGESHES